MAKFELRLQARELRRQGKSVKDIAIILHVSKSSASLWVRDIPLSLEQLQFLKQKALTGAERGRIKYALIWQKKRNRTLSLAKKSGIQTIGKLTKRDLFLAGIAIYWGEGGKRNRRIEFCNSDPNMIQFLLHWLEKCFGLDRTQLYYYLGINEVHRDREATVLNYWCEIASIPLKQFRKTSFKKVQSKKIYDNPEEHFGTLSVVVPKSTKLYYKMLGLIEGLYRNSLST